jgi:hypothetical protein
MPVLIFIVLGLLSVPCLAKDAELLEQIRANILNNEKALVDLKFVCDVHYANLKADWPDFVAADFKRKGDKFAMEGVGVDSRKIRMDGKQFWFMNSGNHVIDKWLVSDYADSKLKSGDHFDEMTDLPGLMKSDVLTLAPQKYEVRGIKCYKLSTPRYDVFVDCASKTKVFKVASRVASPAESVIMYEYLYVDRKSFVGSVMVHTKGDDSTTFVCSMIVGDIGLKDDEFAGK